VAAIVGLAAVQTSPKASLETAKELTCAFPLIANGTWNKDRPHASVKAAALSMHFDSINAAEGTARVTEGFGHFEITARFSGDALHFVQLFKTGPLYVTTVFNSESRDGKLKAVHSRHELTEAVLPGFTSSPEQYSGECEIVR
jgi:hypothetical protein